MWESKRRACFIWDGNISGNLNAITDKEKICHLHFGEGGEGLHSSKKKGKGEKSWLKVTMQKKWEIWRFRKTAPSMTGNREAEQNEILLQYLATKWLPDFDWDLATLQPNFVIPRNPHKQFYNIFAEITAPFRCLGTSIYGDRFNIERRQFWNLDRQLKIEDDLRPFDIFSSFFLFKAFWRVIAVDVRLTCILHPTTDSIIVQEGTQ